MYTLSRHKTQGAKSLLLDKFQVTLNANADVDRDARGLTFRQDLSLSL